MTGRGPARPDAAVLGLLLPAFEGPTPPAWLLRRIAAGGAHGASVAGVPGRPACVAVTPTSDDPELVLTFAQPGHFSATPERPGVYVTRLESTDGSARSLPRSWPVPGGEKLVLDVTATEPQLRLTLPDDSPTTLCNVAPQT